MRPAPAGLGRRRLGAQQRLIFSDGPGLGADLLHLSEEDPARDLKAAHRLELDPLLDAREDEEHRHHRHGEHGTERRDDQRGGEAPPQPVAAHRRGGAGEGPGARPAPQPLARPVELGGAQAAARRAAAALLPDRRRRAQPPFRPLAGSVAHGACSAQR
jgi:hypothetical protein